MHRICVCWRFIEFSFHYYHNVVTQCFMKTWKSAVSFCVIKTNLMHYLSSVYFFSQPLHVSGIFIAHRQEVYCIYTTISMFCAFELTVSWSIKRQTTKKHNTYQLLYIYSTPPDDGLQICPKHVEVDWRYKLRKVHQVGFYCTDVSSCTVNKT